MYIPNTPSFYTLFNWFLDSNPLLSYLDSVIWKISVKQLMIHIMDNLGSSQGEVTVYCVRHS